MPASVLTSAHPFKPCFVYLQIEKAVKLLGRLREAWEHAVDSMKLRLASPTGLLAVGLEKYRLTCHLNATKLTLVTQVQKSLLASSS